MLKSGTRLIIFTFLALLVTYCFLGPDLIQTLLYLLIFAIVLIACLINLPLKNKRTSSVMTEEEMLEILTLITNERLIDRIYSNAYNFYESSIRGRKNIDEKANWLLALTGVCMAGFLTIVGIFYDKISGRLICPVVISLICIFCVSALFAAAIQLYLALRARSDYREVSENDILDRSTIIATERNMGSSAPYDLYITANMLKLGLVNYLINEDKGKWLKRGQICYLLGLGFLLLVCFALSISLVINPVLKGG